MLRQSLSGAGVDVRLVDEDEQAATGVAIISIDATGENQIILAAGANGRFTPERLARALPLIRSASVLLLQLEIPLDTVMRAATEAQAAGVTVVLDPAPARDIPDQLLRLASYVTPNEGELARLRRRAHRRRALDGRRRRAGRATHRARISSRPGQARRPRRSIRSRPTALPTGPRGR